MACKWKAPKNMSAWSGNKGAVAGKRKGEAIIRNDYRLCCPSSPQFLSLSFQGHAFWCRPDCLGAWNRLSGSSCFVQKVDNAILWIYLYPVHNPISFPNIIDCWTVFYPLDSAIYLNNQQFETEAATTFMGYNHKDSNLLAIKFLFFF